MDFVVVSSKVKIVKSVVDGVVRDTLEVPRVVFFLGRIQIIWAEKRSIFLHKGVYNIISTTIAMPAEHLYIRGAITISPTQLVVKFGIPNYECNSKLDFDLPPFTSKRQVIKGQSVSFE